MLASLLDRLRRGSIRVPQALIGGVLVLVGWRLLAPHLWRIRLAAARFFFRFPQRVVPTPAKVLPPPEAEYVGVWGVSPAEARAVLTDEYGFTQLFRAYLHAYDRGENTTYEVASCAYRPDGITGKWQLHVRLFPTGDGRTDVWAHWELNPNVAPIAHLRRKGYDPERGETELQTLVDESISVDNSWQPSR